MKPKDVIQRLEADGWYALPGKRTGHKQFKHPTKPGKVTVAMHSGDLEPYVLKCIEKQSGIKF
jgi:predicted RNA binding protein YcfA (HicA-like mRNA interferase family)